MGRLGLSFGGEAQGVEEAEISGTSSAQGVQAQAVDATGGSRESDTVPYPEPSGTRLWGSGETGRGPDRPGDWAAAGESQDWLEESGLQLGSILHVGCGMSVPSMSAEEKGLPALPENGPNGSSDMFYEINDQFFFSTLCVNLIQRISISRKSHY